MTGEKIYPLIIDARYTVDIDNLADWARYEAMVWGLAWRCCINRFVKKPCRSDEKLGVVIADPPSAAPDGSSPGS